ncbi:helix-turn-helix domain-containing protein [Streptomyces sp. 4.24]|uniref:helix-turn-helix domain-containing protein n=1 Tax=Streptomyces tritrimontium TaxID=3406573 RepID=UPI003BB4E1A4
MKADAGRKYRAYPTGDQDEVLTGWGHTARALWNVASEQRVYVWDQRRYTLRSVEQCRHLTAARAADPASAGPGVRQLLGLGASGPVSGAEEARASPVGPVSRAGGRGPQAEPQVGRGASAETRLAAV